MIRKNALFCKLIRSKKSSKILFDSYMASFGPQKQTCPICGSSGNCRAHAYYGRKIIDFIHGAKVSSDITVLRVICSGCGHTHAILPDMIIPYLSYSLFFILRVLGEAFLHRSSLEQLLERFGITQNQFYHWLKLWKTHKREWLGLLQSADTKDLCFLMEITSKTEFSVFSRDFTDKCSISFLQSHRNPWPP